MAKMVRVVCLGDIEKMAKKSMQRDVLNFSTEGADQQLTLADNLEAFKRWVIRPRMMRGIASCNVSTSLLGHAVDMPIGIAPTGMHSTIHTDGEYATAKASYKCGSCYIMSLYSTTSIEDLTREVPSGLRWSNQFILKDRSITREMIRKADQAGFQAHVLTVDVPVYGQKYTQARMGYTKLLPGNLRLANFRDIDESVSAHVDCSWDDISWMKTITDKPIIIKGILTAEDANLALEYGASAIIVSNHGGRQLDCVPATIDVLPEIVKAVHGRCEVYLDGGVRTGTDVLKALSLGARAVFLGRPIIYGLAFNGEEGVMATLTLLKDELLRAMALSGCRDIASITKDLVVHKTHYLFPRNTILEDVDNTCSK